MSNMIERYVHQVGRNLPEKERADIEAELRSQIQDELDDRYGGQPTEAEIASVLRGMGTPHHIATSYNRDRYLIGPDVYPYMMGVLRNGWILIPAFIVFINIFGAVTASEVPALPEWTARTILSALEVTLIFSAIVIGIFAFFERLDYSEQEESFDPAKLPEVNDPAQMDRFEITFGLVFGALIACVFTYFLSVGGLTLRFDLNNPGDIIPVPEIWLVIMIVDMLAMIVLLIPSLRRGRWTVPVLVIMTVLQLIGVIAMYFVLFRPVYERLVEGTPGLAGIPIPELIAVGFAINGLLDEGRQVIRLWNTQGASPPYSVQPDH